MWYARSAMAILTLGLWVALASPTIRAGTLPPAYSVYLPLVLVAEPAIVHDRAVRLDPSGFSLYVMGEVVNPSSSCIAVTGMNATFYSSAGGVVGSNFGYPLYAVLAPGEQSPFTIRFENATSVASYTLDFSWVPCGSSSFFYQPTQVFSYTVNDPAKGFLVIGAIRNDEPFTVRDLSVIVTIYDTTGDVIWVEPYLTSPLSTLQPGQVLEYQIPTYLNFGSVMGSYRIQTRSSQAP